MARAWFQARVTGFSWDKESIVRDLRVRQSVGWPLHSAAILRDDPPLYRGIRQVFGRHNAALEAAGIDPQCVRPIRHWTAAAVIERMGQRADQCMTLDRGAVRVTEPTLAAAAERCFGSWDAALKAAGQHPGLPRFVRVRVRWPGQRLLQEIRRRHRAGEPLTIQEAARQKMLDPAHLMYGSWKAALGAAGLDPAQVRSLGRRRA